MPTKKTATKKPTKQKTAQAPSSRGSGGAPPTPPRAVADVVAGLCADGFFAPLANSHPFVNAGLYGGPSSGKTRFAAKLAIGLWHRIGSRKPVVIVDTEHGSRFLVGLLAASGVPAVVRPTRSLVDWAAATRRAADGAADIVITDSLSHIWEDFVAAFVAARNIRGDLSPSDWVALKTIWHREWALPFTSLPVHQIFTARSADQYVDVVDDAGKVESIRAGTKIRGEAETGYEPSLLIELRRDDAAEGAPVFTGKVLKDRTDTIDGAVLASPAWVDVAPAVEATIAGAAPAVVVEESSAASLFAAGADARQARRLVEDIKAELTRRGLGPQGRAQMLMGVFGTASWARLGSSDAAVLEQGLSRLRLMPLQVQTPAPEAVVASIRAGLAFDPGDPVERQSQLSYARTLAGQLPPPFRGEALGVVERTARAWEAAEFDQRPAADPWNGDDLPV